MRNANMHGKIQPHVRLVNDSSASKVPHSPAPIVYLEAMTGKGCGSLALCLALSACSSNPGGFSFAASAGGGGAPAYEPGNDGGTSNDSVPYDPVAIVAVKPSPGCGQDPGQAPGQFVRYTIQTSGTKASSAADTKKGKWSYEREYAVWLPPLYDRAAHPPERVFRRERADPRQGELFAASEP